MMTLKELKAIMALRGEISQLLCLLEKHYKRGDYVGDYGYNPDRKKVITISGYATKDSPAAERYRLKLSSLNEKIKQAEEFIDAIDDAVIRVLVREYVINNSTWEVAARAVYGKMTADSARMAVRRYFSEEI